MNKFIFNPLVEEFFEEYCKNEPATLNGIDNNDQTTKKIIFTTDYFFNDVDDSEEFNSGEISDFVQNHNNKIKFYDSIWFDSFNEKEKTISFLKIIKKEEELNQLPNWANVLLEEDDDLIKDYLEALENKIGNEENIKYDDVKKYLNLYLPNMTKLTKTDQKQYTKNIKNIQVNFLFDDDLREKYSERNNQNGYISIFQFKLDKPQNFLTYKANTDFFEKESIVCNLSALSLNNAWNYHNKKLLGKNLRYHIKNKSIDEAVKKSIIENPEMFWFKNNGLVIVCSEATIDGENLNLKNFSIVNGGQTTYSIGNINDIKRDMYIIAKILVIPNLGLDEENEKIKEFCFEVAKATNQQKAIKSSDLIANNKKINTAKEKLKKEGVFLQNKKGEYNKTQLKEKGYKLPNQIFTAEEGLQIIKSFDEFLPGTARNGKQSFYSNEEKLENSWQELIDNIKLYKNLVLIFSLLKEDKKKKNLANLKNKNLENAYKFGNFFFISTLKIVILLFEITKEENEEKMKEIRRLIESSDFEEKKNYFTNISEEYKKRIIWSNFFRFDGKSKYSLADINEHELKPAFMKFSNYLSDSLKKANENDNSVLVSNSTKTNKYFWNFFIPSLLKDFEENQTEFFETFNKLVKFKVKN